MDLFPPEKSRNLLPCDGELHYYGRVLSEQWMEALMALPEWRPDEVKMFGKTLRTARQVIWFGQYDYRYSGSLKRANPWPEALRSLKARVESLVGAEFNACLANRYADGQEGMGWHSDNEPEIVPGSPIASASFGAERRFVFRHKQTREKVELLLESGSLLVMSGDCQGCWQHSLPKSTKIKTSRVNLTFRQMRRSQ